MTDQPLQPFAPPTMLLNHLNISGTGLAASTVVTWFFYLILAFWLIYTLVAIYHWLKYSHAAWISVPAIAVHIVVSIILIGYALSGNPASVNTPLP